MKYDWITLLNSLERSPGDLVYHLVVGLALLLLLLVAAQRRRAAPRGGVQKHVLIGASLLFSLQVLLFILNRIFNLPEQISPRPSDMVEALLHTLTLVWLIWSFIELDESFLITGAALFTTLALVLWSGVSLGLLLVQPAFLPSDNAWMAAVWDLVGIALVFLGCLVFWRKRPQGWGVGTAVLLALGIGFGLQLWLPISPGGIRLAETLALPWVLILLQRLGFPADHPSPEPGAEHKVDTKPVLVDELLKLSQVEKEDEKYQAVARALSLSLIADICYLAELDDSGGALNLLAGYDLIREVILPAACLPRADLPNILNAWEKSQPYHPKYPPFETLDASTLTEVFNFHRIGRILAYPLGTANHPVKGGVIFCSPYTDKAFDETALNLMAKIEQNLSKFLFEPGQEERLSAELAEIRHQASQYQTETRTLLHSLSDSQKLLSKQEEEIRQLKAKYQIDKLHMVKEIDACQEKIIQLSAQAASHKQDMAKLEDLKARIRELITERERLEDNLAQAESHLAELESQLNSVIAPQARGQNEILSLGAIAANIQLIFDPRCQNKGLSLEIANPEGGQLIKTDPNQLQTLINNLLENALLASKPEGSIHFRLNLSYETGMLQMQVTDSGQGLTPGEQRAIFGDMAEPPAGIGNIDALRKALHAVQSLNGKIWLRSKPGAFTTFRVQLPVRILD